MSAERIEQYRQSYLCSLDVGVSAVERVCESEIERLFLFAALAEKGQPAVEITVPVDLHEPFGAARTKYEPCVTRARGQMYLANGTVVPEAARGVPHMVTDCGAFYFWAVPQLPVELDGRSYRVDFAFVPQAGCGCPPFAIELDGHDFHERTKEQAKRDKERDRAFQRAGWTVVSFSGSEVWADPFRCVREVVCAMFWSWFRARNAQKETVST